MNAIKPTPLLRLVSSGKPRRRELGVQAAKRPPIVLPPATFDVRREQSVLTETVLRTAARLIERREVDALVDEFCRALTRSTSRLRLCWTWTGSPNALSISPQTVAGVEHVFGRSMTIDRQAEDPVFKALAGEHLPPFNIATTDAIAHWRAAACERGIRSAMVLPLQSVGDDERGVLVLCADAPDYFDHVGRGLIESVGQLISALLSRKAMDMALNAAAMTDSLTGLMNRRYAEGVLGSMGRLDDNSPPLAVMVLDIDFFKMVNDHHGHDGGDAALKAVAAQILAALRKTDGVARWGGEEFVAWLPGADAAGAREAAEKLRKRIARSLLAMPDGQQIHLTASIGIASVMPEEPVSAAISRADHALYQAKRGGRNRCVSVQ